MLGVSVNSLALPTLANQHDVASPVSVLRPRCYLLDFMSDKRQYPLPHDVWCEEKLVRQVGTRKQRYPDTRRAEGETLLSKE